MSEETWMNENRFSHVVFSGWSQKSSGCVKLDQKQFVNPGTYLFLSSAPFIFSWNTIKRKNKMETIAEGQVSVRLKAAPVDGRGVSESDCRPAGVLPLTLVVFGDSLRKVYGNCSNLDKLPLICSRVCLLAEGGFCWKRLRPISADVVNMWHFLPVWLYRQGCCLLSGWLWTSPTAPE